MRRIIAVAVLIALARPVPALADVLPEDPAQRAFDCEVAVQVASITPGGPTNFISATRAAQFEGLRLMALPGGAFNPDHPTQDWDGMAAAEHKAQAFALFDRYHSDKVVAACDAAYPETLASYPVVLPADADDRFLICEGLNIWMLTSAYRRGYPEVKPYVDLAGRLGPLFSAFVKTRGLKPGPELSRIVVPPIGRALKLGRPDKVLDACVIAFPPAPAA